MASCQRGPSLHPRHHQRPFSGCTRKRSRPPQNGHGPAYSPPPVVATFFSRVSAPISPSRSSFTRLSCAAVPLVRPVVPLVPSVPLLKECGTVTPPAPSVGVGATSP